MASPDSQNKYSEQYILNQSYDETYQSLIMQPLKTPKALKITVIGSLTYIAEAPVGSAQSDAVWQVKKVDESVAGTTVITWADGDGNYDNVATDLTALSYS